MPSTSLETYASWSNYHLTLGKSPGNGLPPAMTIEHMRRIHCADVDETNPLKTMRDTASTLMLALKHTEQDTDSRFRIRPKSELAAGIVGRGWSFRPLIGTPFAQIMAEGLAWIAEVPEAIQHQESEDINLCLCGGGTRLRELVTWAETSCRRLSIETSGTHLGPTVAGAFGTASHGSRLNRGGFQNLVRGMHIITGDNRQIWLHKEGQRVLCPEAIAKLATKYEYMTKGSLCKGVPPKRCTVDVDCCEIIEVEDFENALIHLGCMGVVNAVALELTPVENLAVMAWKAPIDDNWLERIGKGEFQSLADDFGANGLEPEFYELTFDPQKPFSEPAAHLFYFKDEDKKAPREGVGRRPTPGDTVSSSVASRLTDWAGQPVSERVIEKQDLSLAPDPSIADVLWFLLDCQPSLISAYLKSGGFKEKSPVFSLDDAVAVGSWGEIHLDEISGGIPGALYNAAFAIELSDVPEAVKLITAAVEVLSPSFVFTLRFVDEPAGNLAFTRFTRNAVIEIDGLSPFICEQTLRYGREHRSFNIYQEAALEVLSSTVERGAEAVKEALNNAGIDYSMHWAKLGGLNAKKVAEDFGAGGKKPAIDSWQATRRKLLTESGDVFFRNEAAKSYGLLPKLI